MMTSCNDEYVNTEEHELHVKGYVPTEEGEGKLHLNDRRLSTVRFRPKKRRSGGQGTYITNTICLSALNSHL